MRRCQCTSSSSQSERKKKDTRPEEEAKESKQHSVNSKSASAIGRQFLPTARHANSQMEPSAAFVWVGAEDFGNWIKSLGDSGGAPTSTGLGCAAALCLKQWPAG